MASNLCVAKNEIPTSSALSLSDALPGNATFISDAPVDLTADQPKGDFWVVYPFSKSYAALRDPASDTPLSNDQEHFEARIRRAIDEQIELVRTQAVSAGCSNYSTHYILQEALRNATSYIEEGRGHSVIRLEWEVNADPADPSIVLAIANPVSKVFDPAHYLRMSLDEYVATLTGMSGNAGVRIIAGYMKQDSELVYLFELPDGCRIRYSIRNSQEVVESEESSTPLLGVEKFDKEGGPIPGYDLSVFDSDVKDGAKAESVTVVVTVGKGKPPVSDESAVSE